MVANDQKSEQNQTTYVLCGACALPETPDGLPLGHACSRQTPQFREQALEPLPYGVR
jgi:hypothetical protein